MRLKKGVADRLWEELVMAVVGDQFDDCGPGNAGFGGTPTGAADVASWRSGPPGGETPGAGNGNGNGNGVASVGNEPEICGCTLSVRQHEDILSVWNKHGLDSRVNQRIKCVHLRNFLYIYLPKPDASLQRYNQKSVRPPPEYCTRIQNKQWSVHISPTIYINQLIN